MRRVLLEFWNATLVDNCRSFLWSKNGVKSFICGIDRWLAVLKL